MKNQSGQGMLIAVMILGVFLATILIFGSSRQSDLGKDVARLENGQIAQEVFRYAASTLQRKYSYEAACDPDNLVAIVNSFAALGNASSMGLSATAAYAIASPNATGTEKEGRCTGGTGCRQFIVPLENKLYVVTVGSIVADSTSLGLADCPRDATVKLKTTIAGTTYRKRVTLTNICSYKSCKLDNTPTYSVGFSGVSFTSNGGTDGYQTTTPCKALDSRTYGSLTNATTTIIDEYSLRAARMYLETGGDCTGETSLLANNGAGGTSVTCGATAIANLACTVAESVSQCAGTASSKCIPAFDLNKDKVNNEADLAILENYLRGYLISLPVIQLN